MFLKTILVLATPIIAAADPPCPPDWVDATVVGMGCLLFDRTMELTWLETHSYCQTQQQSVSVSMLTQEEVDYVSDLLFSMWDHEGSNYWWTGATDLGREGSWYWASSLTPVGQFIWSDPAFPRNTTHLNCAAMQSGYGALDQDCSEVKY